ncbi:hypothetical protein [Candidatus Hepatobacter penaei]|nr:hypothetical protein [Candidatus Hepatobacter penaei]
MRLLALLFLGLATVNMASPLLADEGCADKEKTEEAAESDDSAS